MARGTQDVAPLKTSYFGRLGEAPPVLATAAVQGLALDFTETGAAHLDGLDVSASCSLHRPRGAARLLTVTGPCCGPGCHGQGPRPG
ncbi:hypothetical protein ACWCV9_12035 [Streptomyces sp. NPDC001606]